MIVEIHTPKTNLIYIYTSQTNSSRRKISKKKYKIFEEAIVQIESSKQSNKQKKKEE